MVIDSSALVAILFREPEAAAFIDAVLAASQRLVGAPSYLETAMVVAGRLGPHAIAGLDRLIEMLDPNVLAFDARQAQGATAAFLRYGKGQHPAGLNFDDCCTYALAAEERLPLLFKGNDFTQTDITAALPWWQGGRWHTRRAAPEQGGVGLRPDPVVQGGTASEYASTEAARRASGGHPAAAAAPHRSLSY